MKLLSIESSCDETAAAVVEDGRKIISSVVSSQVEEHKKYGGVVPEIASRRHCENINGVVEKALAYLLQQDFRLYLCIISAHISQLITLLTKNSSRLFSALSFLVDIAI